MLWRCNGGGPIVTAGSTDIKVPEVAEEISGIEVIHIAITVAVHHSRFASWHWGGWWRICRCSFFAIQLLDQGSVKQVDDIDDAVATAADMAVCFRVVITVTEDRNPGAIP